MSVLVRLCPPMSCPVLSFLDSMRQADIDGRDTPPTIADAVKAAANQIRACYLLVIQILDDPITN